MNTSQFMDKQIMDLSNSQKSNDFPNPMNSQEEHTVPGTQEEIVPSYDFQPINSIGAVQQSNRDANYAENTITGVGIRNYTSLDSTGPEKDVLEKVHDATNAALLTEIDQTMKKHADSLLHALEGATARISQLESRTRDLQNSMDDLKISVGNNCGSTDDKLRRLENIIIEVLTGVQVIRDKQDIAEGQIKLAKQQVSKVEQQSENRNTFQSDSLQQAASTPQQSNLQLPPPVIQPHSFSPPIAPMSALPQNLPPPVQLPNQFPPNQIPSVPQREPYFPPPGQTQDAAHQQLQLPPPHQPPLLEPPQQQYQPPPHPQYSQPPPPPQQHPALPTIYPPQSQPSLGHHHSEEAPYAPPQNYPPSMHQPLHPPSGNPPSQQFYGASSHMYEPPSTRPHPGFSTVYGPPSGSNEPYPCRGSLSQYVGSGSPQRTSGYVKQTQLSSTAGPGGGSSYPQLPTACSLPHALPTASGVGGGSGSAGTGNRVPIDDVVEKVASMGFTREQVRAAVRKLTENGQPVDLNVVLDKVTNDGEGQPQRAWFGR